MKLLKKPSVWCLITVWFAILLAVVLIAGSIMDGYARTINNALGLTGYRSETIDTGETADTEYFKSSYTKTDNSGATVYDDEALHDANVEIADQVQREGATILWNSDADGSTGLPLSSGASVSLFSHSSVDYVYSGTGSGRVDTDGAPTMKEALENAGFSVNGVLWSFYESGAGSSYTRVENSGINEVPYSRYTDEVKNSFSSYGDAAIFVLSRVSGETNDMTTGVADTDTGDYLSLSNQELNVLSQLVLLKERGTFDKIILLLNTPGQINFAQIYDDSGTGRFAQYAGLSGCLADYIDCCIWVGQPGWEGLNEVGRILSGASSPSGHLIDTFAMDNLSAPATANLTYSTYTNANDYSLSVKVKRTSYLVYAEGIYIGYKYYETRYEDTVMGQGNANSTVGTKESLNGWNYSEEVAFPFGYGLSYTTFSYSDYNVSRNSDGTYTVSVTVTNTGSTEGQDAVQIYIQKPYTDHDKSYGIEQAAVNLCGYAKTDMIAPGNSETVKITVDDDSFKTYDDTYYKTYILEKGTYYLTAAQDAHEAVNNILAAKGYTTADGMDADGNTEMVWSYEYRATDAETYSKSASTGYEITNQFDDCNWNSYTGAGSEEVTYLSRSDWESTYPVSTTSLSMTDQIAQETGYNFDVVEDPEDEMPTYGAENGLNLIDLRGLEYDNPYWDSLLDQLTLEEQIELIGTAYHGTTALSSINKPSETAEDGPLGLRKTYTNSSLKTMGFPSSATLAATFNNDLAEAVGEQIGEDGLHSGVSGIYATGSNMHRTAYGGRNFEYYSEDSFISGQMGKAQVVGIQSKGVYVYMKHFLMNDQESQRHGVSIWADEQTIRETYLEAFRPACEEGGATGLMSSFTRMGVKWSGAHSGLCTEVLRNEWGMIGVVISDCSWEEYMGVVDGLMGGNDAILYASTTMDAYYAAETNATVAQAIRQATHRVLYVVANSNAMNGISANTRIYVVWEWWQYAVVYVQIGVGVVTGVSVIVTAVSIILWKKRNKAVRAQAQPNKNIE